jgi:CsoR family transcriptional regulator, copper-sensing transcriptional repressor
MSYKPKNHKERVAHRLKITKGQLEKVIRMVEEDKYCIDVLHQLNAVGCALKQTQSIILEDHLKTCTQDAIKSGDADKAIKEIMTVFDKKHD